MDGPKAQEMLEKYFDRCILRVGVKLTFVCSFVSDTLTAKLSTDRASVQRTWLKTQALSKKRPFKWLPKLEIDRCCVPHMLLCIIMNGLAR